MEQVLNGDREVNFRFPTVQKWNGSNLVHHDKLAKFEWKYDAMQTLNHMSVI